MTRFHDVELEIVRPGPPHNQLLSPLTLYLALCGEGSPITFHINLEHHKLVSRLQQLRYVVDEGDLAVAVPNRMREAAVVELAETVGGVLADIRTLLAEVWRARCAGDAAREESQYVHLRLMLGGSDLAGEHDGHAELQAELEPFARHRRGSEGHLERDERELRAAQHQAQVHVL
jgi:hypothetical protein